MLFQSIAKAQQVFGTAGPPWVDDFIPFMVRIEGSGPPSVNADFIGQWYLDTANDLWYVSQGTGAGAADWSDVGGSGGAGTVSITDFGARADGGLTDCYAAFVAAFASGAKQIIVPYTSGYYYISQRIDIPAGVVLIGEGYRPEIRMATTVTTAMFRFNGISKASIRNLTLNGNYVATNGGHTLESIDSAYLDIREVDFINAKGDCILAAYMQDSVVADCVWKNGRQHGMDFYNSANNTRNMILNNRSDNMLGFGIICTDAANKIALHGNWCVQNGIELIGVTYTCSQISIIGNRASGCGDNGISVTGQNCIVVGNICNGNAHNGICVYGKGNTISGNDCFNNNTAAAQHAGICLSPEFGGQAILNTVTGNNCFDDQAVPTQYAGIKINTNAYGVWSAGQSIASSNSTRYYGLNVYRATGPGTTGATPPTHTTGTVSDGTISWTFLFTSVYNIEAAENVICGNNYYGNQSGRTVLVNSARQNWIMERALISVGQIVTTQWTTGDSTVKHGDVRWYNDAGGVKRIYRATNSGTTGATPPTHTSGLQSDGTVTWLMVAASDFYKQIATSERAVEFSSVVRIRNIEDNSIFNEIISGNGAPSLAGSPGDLFLRRNSGATATNVYIYAAGANSWKALALRDFGDNASRPAVGNGAGFSNYAYFDTDMRRPVFWDGNGISGTGRFVSPGNMAITVTVSTAITIYEDMVLCGARAAGITITLPAPNTTKATPTELKYVRVKDFSGEALTKNITVAAASGNIDADASKTIAVAYACALYFTDGTTWYTA